MSSAPSPGSTKVTVKLIPDHLEHGEDKASPWTCISLLWILSIKMPSESRGNITEVVENSTSR